MNDYPAPRRRVIYFDLFGTLVEWTALGFQPRAAVAPWLELSGDYRMGILCNAKGRHTRDVQRVIEEAGLAGRFAPELLIVATDLPCPLPDRRAFAVAAALAEMPTEACLFVSADQALLVAAAAAGMRTAPLPGALEAAGMDVRALTTAPEEATRLRPGPLLAAVIDEDSGPTFALKGRIVTMNSRGHVFPNGRLVIRGGKIAAVREEGEPLPAWFSGPEIDTGGTIYPGLIDLHNHFVYNVLPLWPVTKRYTNRGQWPRAARYTSEISLPVRALASHAPTARALVRYVEAKALAGGTTTGQGIRTRVDGGARLFRGAMRNVEETDDPRLPEAGTLVVNLMLNEEGIASFRRALQTRVAYFYHLSEGVDDQAAGFWADLLEHDLVQPSLAGIHALGVPPDGLRELGRRGAKIVWSPFSNLLLYGQTLDLEALKDAGVTWSIGCDWSPTGSKNLLQELKVARYVAGQQQVALKDEALVRAVTVNAARVVGWHEHLGVLRRGTLADVLVIHGADGDPYAHLVDATEEQVALVLVHGVARYGDRQMMEALHAVPGEPLEPWEVGGRPKAFFLQAPDSMLNNLTLQNAQATLRAAMSDLPAFVATTQNETAHVSALGVEPIQSFTVELDNEYSPSEDEPEGARFAVAAAIDPAEIVPSVELDPFEVNTAHYWDVLDTQVNVDAALRAMLRDSYGA